MKSKTFIQVVVIIFALVIIGYGVERLSKKNDDTNGGTDNSESKSITVEAVSSDDHILGDQNAPITLIEYSDYQCPYCIKHYPIMQEIVKKYPGKVRWVFRSFPLPFHQSAEKASEAAEAASAQGKFWEYSDLLVKNSQADGTGLAEDDLIKYAETLSLDIAIFKDELSSGKYKSRVDRDFSSGEKAGVEGTPATFLIDKNGNTELISGAVSLSKLEEKIIKALK